MDSLFPGGVIRWTTRHNWRTNGVRLVLLALSTTACAKAKTNDNANNASLTPKQLRDDQVLTE